MARWVDGYEDIIIWSSHVRNIAHRGIWRRFWRGGWDLALGRGHGRGCCCGIIAQSLVRDDPFDRVVEARDRALPSSSHQLLIASQLLDSKAYIRSFIHARGWRAEIVHLSVQGGHRNPSLRILRAPDIQRSRMHCQGSGRQRHLGFGRFSGNGRMWS